MKHRKEPLFTGCATALVTPMLPIQDLHRPYVKPDVDYDAFARLVQRQLTAGIDALVVCGTTGESPTLADEEKRTLFEIAVQESHRTLASGGSHRRVPIIAGTGSNDTLRAIHLSRIAQTAGCDGLLVVTPYYNKANQDGLTAHYVAIARAVPLPLLIYHVPGRTGCHLAPETCLLLSELEQVIGIKDASGDVSFATRVAALCKDDLPLYAGCDDLILPLLSLGGRGVISVASNLYPSIMTELYRAYQDGQIDRARKIQFDLIPLFQALFADVNPIPIKSALAECGLCHDVLRLPLTSAAETVRRQLTDIIQKIGRPVCYTSPLKTDN